jgi:methionine-rich copper-binding protein CopC
MTTKLAAAVAVAFAALTIFAGTVLGHAALDSSDPADGAVIKTPYTLTATYDEELKPGASTIVVQDSSGAQVASGTVSDSDDKTMTIQLPQLPDGQYKVLWTAVTADDNGVTRGTYLFNVAAAASAPTATTAPASTQPSSPAATRARSTAAPAAVPTVSPTSTATTTPGQNTGSGSDLLLPLALVVAIVLAIAAYFLYRNRR